jgi:hypothetical protein
MHRRALLAALAFLRVARPQSTFPGPHADTLRSLAAIVLPTSAPIDQITAAFIRWVRDYRPGAEMEHGYGITRLRNKPPSPASAYLDQLAALPTPLDAAAVQSALERARVADLPRTPGTSHVAADLMAFYFRSSDANDLCYRAAIGRDQCRSLAGSDLPPAPLKERA